MKTFRNRYAAAVVGTILFSAVYELFSHEVYSSYMIYAFLFPLLGGLLPFTLLMHAPARLRPDMLVLCLYNSGLAALTAGSLFCGVLEIYGTTNRLSHVYWLVGALLSLSGLAVWLLRLFRHGTAERPLA